MKKYLRLLLTTTSLIIGTNKVISSNLDVYDQEIRNQLSKNLEESFLFYGEYQGKTLIEDDRYKGFSNLYPESHYPKVPRVHAYDHTSEYTYLSLEFSKIFRENVSSNFLDQIFPKISKDNIHLFLLAQNIDPGQENITLRPHYFIDHNIPDHDLHYNTATNISAAIFNLDKESNITIENLPEGRFYKSVISTHPDNNDAPTFLMASGDDFKIAGYNREKGAFFCSLILYENEKDPTQSKGALTFHIIPPLERASMINEEFQNLIDQVNTTNDIYEKFSDQIESIVKEILLKKIQFSVFFRSPELIQLPKLKDYANYQYRAPGGLFSAIHAHYEEKGQRLGDHWYDLDQISQIYHDKMGDKFFNPSEFLMSAFDEPTTMAVLNKMQLPFQPLLLKDYANYQYRAPGGLFSAIHAHYEEKGQRLGDHWYDLDQISQIYHDKMGDKFFNPSEFLMAAFDEPTTIAVLDKMQLPFQPLLLKDYANYQYRAPGGLFSAIHAHYEEKGQRLGDHWYDLDQISQIYHDKMGDKFFNPSEFLMAAFDEPTTIAVLDKMQLPFQPLLLKDYANYQYRAPGGLFSAIHAHYEEKGQRLGDHWYDLDQISQIYHDKMGDKFFNPSEFLMAAFDEPTTIAVLDRMQLPFQPLLLKDYANYQYRAPGGLFSAIHAYYEEKGQRLGDHWYDLDQISQIYHDKIGDKFFNPSEFLMAAFDEPTTIAVLNKMQLPWKPTAF